MYKIKLTWDRGKPSEMTAFLGDDMGNPVAYALRERAERIIESNQLLMDNPRPPFYAKHRLEMEIVEITEEMETTDVQN
tara:strand:+ start:314 stop:550 length:237 start_codon:yes stop_codon:yes gene_type:complete